MSKDVYHASVEASYVDLSTINCTLNFDLYPSPKSPSKLEMKGNGTSGIMIASVDGVSDQDLATDGYEFVFGYGDATQDGTTANRYYQYNNKSAVQDPNINKWVYTRWDIGERKNIVSSKKKNTIGEDTYTRGGTTAIESLECGDVVLRHGRLIANLASPASAKIALVSLSGTIVKRIELPASDHFDESLDLNGLAPGLYVIRCNVGSQRVEQKVVVK